MGRTLAGDMLLGGGPGLLERRMNSSGNEAKLGPARHAQWTPGVMGEHEDRCVIRRLLAPPTSPAFVGPWAANGPEHVAAEDPGTEAGHSLRGSMVIDASLTA